MPAPAIPPAAPYSATRDKLIGRIQRLMTGAMTMSPLVRGAMASPPTITQTVTQDVSLNKIYTSPSGNFFQNVALFGGLPFGFGTTNKQVKSWTTSTNSALALASRPVGTINVAPNSVSNRLDVNGFGSTFEFVTDAPKLQLSVNGYAATMFRLAVDGQYISLAPQALSNPQVALFMTVDFGTSAIRRITFETCDFLTHVAVSPLYSVWAPGLDDVITAAFVTDSWGTNGNLSAIAALNQDCCWGQAANLLGWRDARMVSIGGTGLLATSGGTYATYRQRLTGGDVTQHNPHVVWYPHSVNDQSGAFTAAALQAEVTALIAATRAALPNALIVFSGCPSLPVVNLSAGLLANEAATAAAVAASGDPLTIFVPVSTANSPWLFGTGRSGSTTGNGNNDNYMGVDGLHPTLAGRGYLGQRAAAGFRSAFRAALAP